ncbi:hypothetical protein Poli38472_009132 [Pythium oligandrum]|uniref:Cyclic nucleotide-binding domain-containing protein n=1 Tax=Pythium oligandrum TaxID=41045 RepID=A0A8K1FIG7_PYTOL|nr:hypothetical protein Poli38472_009132 [Pythium oligandrum]|eukprot:TMW64965.1 hypothetical protein Poli38472_009132 [Pythium oligandrum]
MLELNRCTADLERGCTVHKLHRDRVLKLRSRFEMRKPHDKVTARFSGHSAARNRAASMTGPEKIHLINSIVESEVVNYLFEIPFLEGVDDSRLVTLSNLCSYMFIRRDEVLCKEGEIGDCFFHLHPRKSPGVSTRHPATETQSTHRNNRRAQVAGRQASRVRLILWRNLAALQDPGICSITALEDSLLVYIDRVAFCNFLKIVPKSSLVLLEHVRLHFLDTLIKQGCRFLNAFPHLKLQELSFISELVERQEGETILRREEKFPGFYILLRGQVQLEYFAITNSKRDDEQSDAPQTENASSAGTKATTAVPPKEIVTVGPGGYFGQEAIILGISSPIRVKCLDHCLLLRLTNEGFAEFFSSLPVVYSEFCIKCLRDRVRPEHVMQHYEAHKLWAADCVTRRRNQEIALFEQIEDFKWEADLAEERIHERALVVYFRFLAQNAPNCVRVSPKSIQQIESELSSHMISRDIFQSVRNEILELMEDDHF